MKKAFAILAVAVFVLLSAQGVQARTVESCNNDVPPVCETKTIGGRRHPQFFFQKLGINVSTQEAQELFSNREIRNEVMRLWRVYLEIR